ncbi:MAG: hypothetical protein ABIE94_02590, partial [archaeon]
MIKKEVFERLFRRLVGVASVYYLIVLFVISYLLDKNLFIIFIGILPLFIYILAFFLIHKYAPLDTRIVWILPLVFSFLFLSVWYASELPFLRRMNGEQLFVLNLVLSYFLNLLFILAYQIP